MMGIAPRFRKVCNECGEDCTSQVFHLCKGKKTIGELRRELRKFKKEPDKNVDEIRMEAFAEVIEPDYRSKIKKTENDVIQVLDNAKLVYAEKRELLLGLLCKLREVRIND